MYSHKKHIKELADILYQKNIRDVVLSPGSRNAPLTLTFSGYDDFRKYVIVDERSAAFFAMGIALYTGRPVVLACTSGTAVLNYSPALAEAFYLGVPLIVLTADRPAEWVDQADGQAIKQKGIYDNYVKKSFELPAESVTDTDLWYSNRTVSEAVNRALLPKQGPVHINIPLREPLYSLREYFEENPKSIILHDTIPVLTKSSKEHFEAVWKQSRRILIVAGQMPLNRSLNECLQKAALLPQVTVLTETLSNLHGDDFVFGIDNMMASFTEKDKEDFRPQLLITIGGNIITRRLKAWLRKYKPHHYWLIDESGAHIDPFQRLTDIIPLAPEAFFNDILNNTDSLQESTYRDDWQNRKKQITEVHAEYVNNLPYCDLKVFEQIIAKLPPNSDVHWGNSTPVRYAQLFLPDHTITQYANRGTSGIDGCVSTAAGFASQSARISTVVVGDLSFVYDSNSLWNKYLSDNLRIIVINNQGGDIFRFIEGASEVGQREEFFATPQQVSIRKIAEAFGVKYLLAEKPEDIASALDKLYTQKNCTLLEIVTPADTNMTILKQYFTHFKTS